MIERLYQRVSEICTSQEEVLFMAVQQKPIANFSPDCVVLTNKRFIIFRQKMLGRMNFVDCLWKDSRNVHMQENIIGATVFFTGANGHTESVDYLPKAQARMLYRHGQEQEEKAIELRRGMKLEELNAGADKTFINQAISAAPLVRNTTDDLVAKLTQLKQLVDAGVITEEDYAAKKAEYMRLL